MATALWLSGCSLGGLFAPDEARTYDLVAPETVRAKSRRMGAQLVVPEPTALRALDNEHIVIRPSSAEINYLGDVQWSDSLPRLIQARMIETLERAGTFRAVSRPGSGLSSDYELMIEIRHFEVNAGEAPTARVTLSARLAPTGSGRSVMQKVFDRQAPVAGVDAANVTQGLNKLLGEVLADMAHWLGRR